MNRREDADPHGVNARVRRLDAVDALVLGLALAVVALCSWPARVPSVAAVVAWALLDGGTRP